MKSVVLPLILLVALVFCVIFFSWIAVRYDPRQFQLSMERELSRRWGAKVHFQSISIGEYFPPRLEIRGLVIQSPKTDEVLAKAGRVILKPLWGPWLFKRLVISLAQIHRPEIYLQRTAKGRWNWDLDSLKPARPLAEKGRLSVQRWQILGGTLNFLDESSKNHFHFSLQGISTDPHPGDFETPLQFRMDPQGAGNLGGVATWDLRRRILIFQTEDPGGRTLRINGEIYPNGTSLQERVKFQFFDKRIDPQKDGGGILSGTLSGILDGATQGTDFETLASHFEGHFHGALRQGSFHVLNIPQGILVKISRIPSFGNLIDPPYPNDIRNLLTRSDTPFDLLECDFELKAGQFRTKNLRLRHTLFAVFGAGHFNFNGEGLALDLAFRPSAFLAAFMLSRVPELDALGDPNARLTVPFNLQGAVFKPLLELPFGQIARRLVEIRGEELAARGFQKLNEFLEIQQ